MHRLVFCILFAVFSSASLACAQGILRLDFEGAEPSWRDAGGDARYTLDQQSRVAGAAQAGNWCEHVRLTAGNGTFVYLRHEVGAARVIEELKPSVWVKANRPGVQLLARVVLPRTPDAAGQPVTTYIRGAGSARGGAWEQLRLEDVPRLLERQAIFLRTRLGSQVDTREAYIDNLVLNIYGGPGVTEIWIDDLEIDGFVGREPAAAGVPAVQTRWSAAGLPRPEGIARRANVELNGPILMVDGHPFFPRMIDHQGESLGFLKQLGFNTVKFAAFPSPTLLAEAEQAGLWIVCPPPLQEPTKSSGDLPGWNSILCWDLGSGLTNLELDAVKARSEELRGWNANLARPLSGEADACLRLYSRHIDLLRASRLPLGTSLELGDYGVWLRERPKLARPGTGLWTTVQTQPPAALDEQLTLLTGQNVQASIDSDQLRLLTFTALAAGARGLCFESRTRLDGDDPASRRRAMALELINLELEIIAPWCAGGTLVANVPGSDPEVLGAVLQTDRARLLLPLWVGRSSQMVPGQSAGNGITFTVPGVPESCDAHEVTPAGMRSLKSQRKTGGMRVTLDEFGLTTMVVLTNDALAMTSLSKKLESTGRRAARLQRDLVAARIEEAESIDRRLAGRAPPVREAEAWLQAAKTDLAQCDVLLAAAGYQLPNAYQQAQRALRPVRLLQRAHWEHALKAARSAMAVPGSTCFSTLPEFWGVMAKLQTAPTSLNVLPAGDFEDLDRLVQTGWRHFQHAQEEIQTEAQLVTTTPHGGKHCLQLSAALVDPQAPPAMVETPPIWVQSAATTVEAGQWVRIHGWVQVPAPIVGSVDGLMIFDSLSGLTLAERLGETQGWQEFSLYRVAPRSGPLVVTFALTGLGVARIDDVSIEPVGGPAAQAAQTPQQAQTPLIRRLPPIR